MGVNVKLGIKQIDFADARPDDSLLPIELDFYKGLTRKVFVCASADRTEDSEIWGAVGDFWDAACRDASEAKVFLHESYKGIVTADGIVNDKESAEFHIAGGLAFRHTLSMRIGPRGHASTEGATFVLFDYAWEFTNSGSKVLFRENGMYSQTWVREGRKWKLLGMIGGPST